MEPLTWLLLEFIAFFVKLIILAMVFYVAGIVIVGKKRALLGDALIITLLGTIISTFFIVLLPGTKILTFDGTLRFGAGVGALISLIAWLLLIRHYYETGWLGALAVAVLAVIIYIALRLILAILLVLPALLLL